MIGALAFIVGTLVGSFLNVCIGRIPAGESIVRPRSHCPLCGALVRSRDNIPILAYFLLGRRCRDCGAPISWRYPAIEALTGLLYAWVVLAMGPTAETLVALGFVSALVVITFIDIDHQIIPDVISLPGIVVGLGCSLAGFGPRLLDSFIGVLLGGGMLWAVAAGYERLRGQEGMGGGDIKLLAMVGAFLGWRNVLVTLLVGSLSGAVIGIVVLQRRGDDATLPIPFGPFLAIGAFVALLYGTPLSEWYLGILQ